MHSGREDGTAAGSAAGTAVDSATTTADSSGSAIAAITKRRKIARLAENLLQNPLHGGGPVNPPNGGGLARVRNTIKAYVGPLTNDERIAAIANLIASGNSKRNRENRYRSGTGILDADAYVLIEEIKRIDPDVDIKNISPYPKHNYVFRNGEFTDAYINYRFYRMRTTVKLFVLRHYGPGGIKIKQKVYAVLDPTDGIVYKLDIENKAIKVLDTKLARPDIPGNARVALLGGYSIPKVPDYVEVGRYPLGPISVDAIMRDRTASRIRAARRAATRINAAVVARASIVSSSVDTVATPSATATAATATTAGSAITTAIATAVSRRPSMSRCNVMRRRTTQQASSRFLCGVAPTRKTSKAENLAAATSATLPGRIAKKADASFEISPSVNIFKNLLSGCDKVEDITILNLLGKGL